MFDDIGLGKAIANVIYLAIIIIGAYGSWFLVARKKIFGAILWMSVILNILLYLYFMGRYSFHPRALYFIIVIIWPYINIALAILLALGFLKNKYFQKK